MAAIILAAGCSSRMGTDNKLLMKDAGVPILRRAALTCLAVPFDQTIVVLGHDHHQTSAVLKDLEVRRVLNPNHRLGMSTSLQVGVREISPGTQAVAIFLGDMPRIHLNTIRKLILAAGRCVTPYVVAPALHGRRGHPVLWSRSFFEALEQRVGDAGGRGLFRIAEQYLNILDVEDPGIIMDIDTPEDYNELTGQR